MILQAIPCGTSNECRELAAALGHFEAAASGQQTLVSTILGVGEMLPLMVETMEWPHDCAADVGRFSDVIRRLAPVLSSEVAGRIQAETVYFGLGCLSSVVAKPCNEFAADQLAYSRILFAELMIVRDRKDIAARGTVFLHQFRSDFAWGQPDVSHQLSQ